MVLVFFGMFGVDVPNGAVGGSWGLEALLLGVLLVGPVRQDVEGLVGILGIMW